MIPTRRTSNPLGYANLTSLIDELFNLNGEKAGIIVPLSCHGSSSKGKRREESMTATGELRVIESLLEK